MISTKKLATIGATAALFASTAMPAFATHNSGVRVYQSNTAGIENLVEASSNTGNNTIKASDDVDWGKIKTGNATTGVSVSNTANSNVASVDTCGCSGKKIKIRQSNSAEVGNTVLADSNTGGNLIRSKHDDVEWGKIKTGNAMTGVSVDNLVNSNVAVVGGSSL